MKSFLLGLDTCKPWIKNQIYFLPHYQSLRSSVISSPASPVCGQLWALPPPLTDWLTEWSNCWSTTEQHLVTSPHGRTLPRPAPLRKFSLFNTFIISDLFIAKTGGVVSPVLKIHTRIPDNDVFPLSLMLRQSVLVLSRKSLWCTTFCSKVSPVSDPTENCPWR